MKTAFAVFSFLEIFGIECDPADFKGNFVCPIPIGPGTPVPVLAVYSTDDDEAFSVSGHVVDIEHFSVPLFLTLL